MPPKNAKWVSKLKKPATRRVRKMPKMLKLARMANVMLVRRIRALRTQMQNIADVPRASGSARNGVSVLAFSMCYAMLCYAMR
eukprot:7996054-Pyramimonas_sp.AAC.2